MNHVRNTKFTSSQYGERFREKDQTGPLSNLLYFHAPTKLLVIFASIANSNDFEKIFIVLLWRSPSSACDDHSVICPLQNRLHRHLQCLIGWGLLGLNHTIHDANNKIALFQRIALRLCRSVVMCIGSFLACNQQDARCSPSIIQATRKFQVAKGKQRKPKFN